MAKTSFKSVHITNYYHKNSGGISTSYNNLLDAAARHKRYVRLIVPGEAQIVEDVNQYARIYYVPAKYSPIFDRRYRVMMPWQYMLKDTVIRKILLAEMPEMIEVTDKYTLSLMGAMIRTNNFKKLGRPMLVHFSCERMDDNIASFLSGGKFGKWFARRIIGNYTFPLFDFHIANSLYTAAEFYEAVEEKYNPRRSRAFLNFCWRFFKASRIPADERIYVCPRGVDSHHFSPERRSGKIRREMCQRASVPEAAVILLYAGRISPEKNIGLLTEMMKILAKDETRDFRLLVAGEGPKADWLNEEIARKFPNKIILLGHLDKDTLADYYANADAFVHPNPKEPFGIAPLEAMASGTPTVAPASGGILTYASNDNAWLVEPTGEDFARAARQIIDDETLRKSKIEKALETARNHTREKSTDFLFATYDKMYEDFQRRRELFTDMEKARDFDFTQIVNRES